MDEIEKLLEEAQVEIAQEITSEDLKTLSTLGLKQQQLEEQVEKMELALKDLKGKLHLLSTGTIPDAMSEVGLSSITLDNGTKLEVVPFYSASIPKNRYDEAMQWLIDHEHSDIIRSSVEINFRASEFEKAFELQHNLEDQGWKPVTGMKIHGATLKKWIKEMTESGEAFPLPLFGAYIGNKTKLTRSK